MGLPPHAIFPDYSDESRQRSCPHDLNFPAIGITPRQSYVAGINGNPGIAEASGRGRTLCGEPLDGPPSRFVAANGPDANGPRALPADRRQRYRAGCPVRSQ